MPVRVDQKTLQERLNEVSRNLQRIGSGQTKPDAVVYESDGDRVSVIIKPRRETENAA